MDSDKETSATTTAAEQAEAAKLDSQDDGQIGEGYKDKPRRKSRFTTRQKAASGGIAGLLIGGGLGVFTIISGPLQFIHIAQLLQRFHFQSGQDTGNSRVLKMYKWSKNARAGTAENARLSYLGKKIAVNMDARLAEAGITKTYSETGLYKSTEIDPLKFSENAASGEDFKRLPKDEFKAKFEESFGVKLTEVKDPLNPGLDTGRFTADEGGFFSGYFKNRRLNKMLASEMGHDGVAGSIVARIMGKRDGVTWHPIKRLDSKIVGAFDAKLSAFLEEMKQRIHDGETKPSAYGETKPDPNNKGSEIPDPKSVEGADTVNGAVQEAQTAVGETGSTEGIIARLSGSTAGRWGIGGTAVIGVICAAKALSESIDKIRHDLVILPLIRTGIQAISLGNQVMSGQDIDIEQLGFFSRQLYNEENGSWASAKSIQAELGQEQTGKDIPDEANIGKLKDGNVFTQFINAVPGVGPICKAAESTIGKVIQFAVSLTTPVATIIQTAIMESPPAKELLAGMVKWLAGSPIPSYVVGSTFGNYINYGSRLASNDSAAAVGGSKLSPLQARELRNYTIAAAKEENSQKPIAKKIFDIKSPDSLMSIALDKTSPQINTNMASIVSNITNPGKFLGLFKLAFMGKINAASDYDYGFEKVGFSLNDLQDSRFDNPYDNADKAKALLAGASGKENRDRAQKCFGVTISEDGDTITTDFSAKVDPTDKDYPDYCADTSENWTRIRFYILDMKTAEATDCFDSGDSQSCQNVGFSSSASSTSAPTTTVSNLIVGDPYSESQSVACADGTKDLGVFDTYTEGVAVKGRLCALVGILPSIGDESNPGGYYINGAGGAAIVNSRVSGAWASLVKAAQSEGVVLRASSSFRTMQHQTDLCNQNAGCRNGDYTEVAEPGNSSHQAGVAIDFSLTGGNDAKSNRTCSNRDTRPDTQYQWLRSNASRFGFKQYANEAWHFDALNTDNRCL